ncbi:MAG: aldehyde ferredoxin oxidoreductase family protein [Promethearchaeota archaeon]
MVNGYMGKILIVDLASKDIKIEKPNEDFYLNYLGGTGTGVRYLYDNQRPGIDPLGSESIFGLITGLFNGTNIPFSGRYSVVGKSPLTGTWGDANSGGYFGTELKKAGYDAVFIKNISEKPVYLWIKDDEIEIRDAGNLWGKETGITDKMLKAELGDELVKSACIGPGGEKLSLISAVMTDHGRAAARSGLGALMGSKKLKAVAVRGTNEVNIFNPERLSELKKEWLKPLKKKPSRIMSFMMWLIKPILPWILRQGIFTMPDVGTMVDGFRKYGTTMSASVSSEMGDSPCKNWSGAGSYDFSMKKHASKISDDYVVKHKLKGYGCQACPIRCGAVVKIPAGPFTGEETHRPEYETLAAFGSMLLNDDINSIIKANEICDSYGLDTISVGSAIAFTTECYENGILTKDDIDGIDLTWGNAEAIVKMTEKLAKRQGFGAILADGVKRAAEKIGKGSEQYAMHVGGQEIPMHDPRLNPSFGTTYVTDPTPGRHTAGGAGFLEFGMSLAPLEGIELPKVKKYEYEGKGEAHVIISNALMLLNCVGICQFSGMFGTFAFPEILEAITGWKLSIDDLLKTGERVQVLRQAFNVREGIKPSDFKLPDRIKGIPPLKHGPLAGKTIDLDTLVKEFYKAADWNPVDGKPSIEKLQSLGLGDIADEFY